MPRLKEPAAKRLGAYPSTSSVARCAFLLGGFFSALVVPCSAAAQNQYVYLSSPSPGSSAAQQTLSGFLLDPVKGSLTLVTGSPFPERFDPEQMALHPSGKFLFIVNSSSGTNNVSVFQIDPSTGALTENPHSPFSTSGGSTPQVIVSEPTGRYLYVGNFQSLNSNSTGIVNSYQIDQATGDLTPTSAPATSTPVNPVGLVSDPTGKRLYAYGGSNPAAGLNGAAIQEYTIDSATGNLAPVSGGGIGTSPRCLAMDPKGRFLFSGRGQAQGFIDSNPIAAADGSIQTPVTFSLAPNTLPESLAVDNGGNFLYAVVAGNLRGFSIDQTTGALTEIQSSPFGTAATTLQSVVADPIGPFVYALNAGIEAFQIGSTGALMPVAGSPFFSSLGGVAITMTGATQVQPVSGPVAEVAPTALSFGDVVLNTPNGPKPVQLTNVGNEGLAIGNNGITVSGTNSTEFTEQNTCPAVLGVGLSCTINVTFKPADTGTRQATLSIADNAPGSPQTVALSGNGVPPVPGVTLIPGSLPFPDTAVGDSSVPKIVTLTNSGLAVLSFSGTGISVTGSNAADFSESHDCGATLAASASCTITVTFKPTGTASRTATLNIVDNAPDTPQKLSLSGNGNAPFSVLAGSGGSTTSTVNAGQTAQYNLQVMPTGGFSGAVALQCSGAPTAALCMVSTSPLQVSAGVPAPFSVSVTTTARANAQFPTPPISNPEPRDRHPGLPWLFVLLCVVCGLILFPRRFRTEFGGLQHRLYARAVLAGALCAILLAVGCGGGGMTTPPPPPPPPPPVGTPAGTYTLSVTANSGSITQILNLTLKVN